jgi:hypothetical protein
LDRLRATRFRLAFQPLDLAAGNAEDAEENMEDAEKTARPPATANATVV